MRAHACLGIQLGVRGAHLGGVILSFLFGSTFTFSAVSVFVCLTSNCGMELSFTLEPGLREVGCFSEGVFEGTFTICHESETPLSHVVLKKQCDIPSSIRHSVISMIFAKKRACSGINET